MSHNIQFQQELCDFIENLHELDIEKGKTTYILKLSEDIKITLNKQNYLLLKKKLNMFFLKSEYSVNIVEKKLKNNIVYCTCFFEY